MNYLGIAFCLCLVNVVPLQTGTDTLNLTMQKIKDSSARFEIGWKGRLSTVHRDGDASPHVKLEDITGSTGAFAMGPLAGLRGEITVLDGVPFITRINNDTIEISHDSDVEAAFLVYGVVDKWKAVNFPDSIQSVAELEQWLSSVADSIGLLAKSDAFPFKIIASQSHVDFHVISNLEPGYKISRPHRELMRFFTLQSTPLTLLGVFSRIHAGVFTHHDQWTHIHVVSEDGRASGHVDSLQLGSDAVLYLPEIE